MAKFVITKRANGAFQFVLTASNGQTILTSEGYKKKPSCLNGIERKTATNGKAFFNLKAINGQIVGTSQLYASVASKDNGFASVKTNAAAAATDDKTL